MFCSSCGKIACSQWKVPPAFASEEISFCKMAGCSHHAMNRGLSSSAMVLRKLGSCRDGVSEGEHARGDCTSCRVIVLLLADVNG